MTSQIPVILEENHDLPLVEVRNIIRTGTIFERPEVAGVGRLALRLLRRGAAGMGRNEIDAKLDQIAAGLSAQATPDFYALYLRALRRNVEQAAEIFAQTLNEPTLDSDELDRLKRETIAEIVSSRDDDRHLASRALRHLIYGEHPYGTPSRGTLESVERISIDDVREFLKQNLTKSNFLVGSAGDIDESTLRDIMGRTVERLPADEKSTASEPAATTRKTGIRVILVDKPARTQCQIFLGHLGPEVNDPYDLPLRVALIAFGGTFTSRMMQEVRVKRGWSYGAYSSLGRGTRPEVLSLWAFPALKDAVPCLSLLRTLFSQLKSKGLENEEVSFATDYLARSFAFQRDTAPARLTLRLRQEILGFPKDYYDTFTTRVREVTPDQTSKALGLHLDTENLAIAITCTASEIEDDLRRELGEEATIETIPYDAMKI